MTMITRNDLMKDDDYLDRKFEMTKDEILLRKIKSEWKGKDFKGSKRSKYSCYLLIK